MYLFQCLAYVIICIGEYVTHLLRGETELSSWFTGKEKEAMGISYLEGYGSMLPQKIGKERRRRIVAKMSIALFWARSFIVEICSKLVQRESEVNLEG